MQAYMSYRLTHTSRSLAFPATISEIAIRTVPDPPLTVHVINSPPSSPTPPPSPDPDGPDGGGGGASRSTAAAAAAGTPDPAVLNHYAHHIRLALPSGRTEEYAFDLTSAQYGWGGGSFTNTTTTIPSNSDPHSHSKHPPPPPPPAPPPGCPLVPWHTYTMTRIQTIHYTAPLGSLRLLDDMYVVLGLRGVVGTASSSSSPSSSASPSPSSSSSPYSGFASFRDEDADDDDDDDEDSAHVAWWALTRHWDDVLAVWEEEGDEGGEGEGEGAFGVGAGKVAGWAGLGLGGAATSPSSSPSSPSPSSSSAAAGGTGGGDGDADGIWQAKQSDALAWLETSARALKKDVRDVVEVYGGAVGEAERAEVAERVRAWAGVWWPPLAEELAAVGLEEVGRRLRERRWDGVMDGYRGWRYGAEKGGI
ncbi:hypothetical protein SLS55_000905 [Diplodia seriata]|uniref:Uncharacterized protein n=1 Tax=Diplodia seriata TaxID=420778 RepID=A0ABR3CVP1_9PEZI